MSEEVINAMKSKIITDAEKEAAEILKNAQQKYENELNEFKKQLQSKTQQLIKTKEEEYQQLTDRKIAEAKVYSKREMLDKKEELIETVFEKVKKQLEEIFTTEKYLEYLKKVIKTAALEIGGGEIIVYPSDKTPINKINLDEISNEITKTTGVKTRIKEGKTTLHTLGGVVVKNKDETVEVNYTLETILENAKKTLRSKVAEILFG
ncbi:MAG: V-type ATP synthase subunit E [Candidatus Odinarchaeia archaeon]